MSWSRLLQHSLVGLINAALTVKIGVNSIIVTIGTAFAVRGVSYLFTNGVPIYPLPEAVDILGDIRPFGLSVAFFLMLAVMVLIQIVLNRTRWGQMIFATGGNREAAEVCGINTGRVKPSRSCSPVCWRAVPGCC